MSDSDAQYVGMNIQGEGWRHYFSGQLPWEYDEKKAFCRKRGDEGWKLHISATTPEAQQALGKLCQQYKILQYKQWADPAELQSVNFRDRTTKQYGKTFVVYCTERNMENQTINWERFIEEAEATVIAHGGAGMPVRGDRKIPGSTAVYYRCDQDEEGWYVGREMVSVQAREGRIPVEARYNPYDKPDPFKDTKIGAARSCDTEVLHALDAVYSGSTSQVIRAANKLAVMGIKLAEIKDPATGKTALQIAEELAAIELQLRDTGEKTFQSIINMPALISKPSIVTSMEVAQPKVTSPSPPAERPAEKPMVAYIKALIGDGRVKKLGNAVFFQTNDSVGADALKNDFRKNSVFPNSCAQKTALGNGVLVHRADFEKQFPGRFAQLPSVNTASLTVGK